MSVNVSQSHTTTGAKTAIMLNRYGNPQTSVSVQISGTATYTVEGTISKINQGETAVWNDLPNLTTNTANAFEKVENSPLEAIRIDITAISGTVDFQVAQNS